VPRYQPDDDEDDDLPDGVYDDDEPPTVPCPYCREPLPEDAQYCSRCEKYISAEDAPPARKPTWIVIGLLVCLLLAIMMAFL
jgi:predicted nucleic acid-binding Zn ribbon protein